MKRKLTAFVATLLLAASLLSFPAAAAEPSTPAEPGISPTFVDASILTATCELGKYGKTSSYGYVKAATSSNICYLTLTLQKSATGAAFSAYTDPWSTSGTGSASLGKDYYVVPGYYYRAKVVATLYTASGAFVETITGYSPASYY